MGKSIHGNKTVSIFYKISKISSFYITCFSVKMRNWDICCYGYRWNYWKQKISCFIHVHHTYIFVFIVTFQHLPIH